MSKTSSGGNIDASKRSRKAEAAESDLLLMDQSNVLDEVDQLVDLMTAEKAVLTQKLTKLEGEVQELHEQEAILRGANTKLRSENTSMLLELANHEDQNAKVTEELEKALELAKQELGETRAQIDGLTQDINEAKHTCKELSEENLQIKEKLNVTQSQHTSASTSLEIQRSESAKVVHQLSSMKEMNITLCAENQCLETRVSELQEKLRSAEGTIYAMKGRAANSKRHKENLKLKCSSLEKALEVVNSRSPTVVKVQSTERTREELRLMELCRKKEEALGNCTNELAANKETQKKQHFQILSLERTLRIEREKNGLLFSEFEAIKKEKESGEKELKEKLKKCNQELKSLKKKEEECTLGRNEVERNLVEIEKELKGARKEVKKIRADLVGKERQWQEERQKWQTEKEELIRAHKQMSGKLKQMESQHEEEGGAKLKEAREDYRRLKEASTKRCTELAREVWKLKSHLQDLQGNQRVHHKPSLDNHYSRNESF